jgi:hypothetical protein
MTLISSAASLISGLVAAVGWMGQHLRSFNVTLKAWTCLGCGVPNELARDTCWSCGEGYGEDPLFPSRIPFDRRWLCPECAVWNGIARSECWRCGATNEASRDPAQRPRTKGLSRTRRNT